MDLLNKFTKYLGGSVFTLMIGLITTPIITRLIGPNDLGKYSMFITIGALLSSFLYLGLDQAFVRFYYKKNEDERSELLKLCLMVPIIATILVSIAIMIFKDRISEFIIGKKSFGFIVFFNIYILCLVCNRFTILNIRMKQKAFLYSILNILHKIMYLIFSILLYYFIFGSSYYTIIYGMIISEVLFLIISIICEKNDYIITKHSINKGELKSNYKHLIKYGFPFIFSSAITYIFQSTDKVMLNIMSTYAQVGIYSGALNIVNLLSQVQYVFTTFWVPVAMEHYSRRSEDKEFFIKINKIISYVMLVGAMMLLLLKDLIIIFLGSEYRDAQYVFPFLIFMPIMYTISETTVVGINFKEKSMYHILISAITSIFNIILNYILISIIAAKGAAISTGISYILFFILRTILSKKCYKVKYELGKFFISCSMVYIFAIYASFSNVTVQYILIGILNLILISCIYKNDVKEIINYIKQVLAKLKLNFFKIYMF